MPPLTRSNVALMNEEPTVAAKTCWGETTGQRFIRVLIVQNSLKRGDRNQALITECCSAALEELVAGSDGSS